ncbi:hypothetical protein KC878_03970 [Candidatus Saccharibacteria bacterium]|nr:hypothetical protein [Candidatus Saccharibacteria bacterium]MCB9820919.1 hypothetical protein [Candidatus Nomurabacteria bacterium]
MVFLVLASIIAVGLFSIGLLALNNRSKHSDALAFAAVCFATSLWIVVNQLGSNSIVDITARETLTALDYSFGTIMVWSFANFSFSLAGIRSKLKYILLATTLLLAFGVFFGKVMTISIASNNELNVSSGLKFYAYLIYVLAVFIIGAATLYRAYIKAIDKRRRQLELIVWSLGLAGFVSIMANLILPKVFIDNNLLDLWASITYASILLFAVLSSVALLKRGVFDVRQAATRSVGYLLTFSLIFGLYFVAVFGGLGASSYFSNITNSQKIVLVGSSLILAVSYLPLKNLFNKVTNKLFYRDAYDTQNFIDELNKTLVSGMQFDELLTKSALIIQKNLKASYVTFYIRPTSYFPERIIGARRSEHEFDDIALVQETAKQLNTKVFMAGEGENEENANRLSEYLKKNDVEVLVRLVNSLDYQLNGIGYIFIGSKLSGNVYSKKDLQLLEIVANELVIAIENSLRFEEIEEFNVTLQNKIEGATKELRKSNEKLTALDEAKDEFISMASHQLRTPLTSVKGYISMVMEGDAGDINEQQSKLLNQAFISSQRMVYLIADLLNVSRLRTGKFVIETHPTKLAEVVDGEVNQLRGAAEAHGLKLLYEKPADFPDLMLDETKIRQVIMNFIDNAIYYTPKGNITVYLRATKTSVEFGVTDTGMGVPKKEIPKLFNKFYRANNARKARPDGTGLGLFMAKKVIVASGGSILFKTKEGKGSTFGFIFPLDKVGINNH